MGEDIRMTTYSVDCWKSKNTAVKKGDKVLVEGNQGKFNKTLVKAKMIENLTQNGPICACGEPDFPIKTKLLTYPFEKIGIVTSVTEIKDGFCFYMKSV